MAFYHEDTSPSLEGWEAILDFYQQAVSEEEVWAVAREYENCPHFGNIYQYLVLENLTALFYTLTQADEDEVNVEIAINARCSHFYIGDSEVDSLSLFQRCVAQYAQSQQAA